MTNSDRAKQYMAKRETSSLSSSASKAEGKKNSDRAKAYMLGKQYNFSNISSDEETVRKLLTSTYEGWQSADTMTSNKTAISNMYKRLDAYRTINGTNDDLDSLIGVYRSALDNWDNLANAYGQYQNADAYASAQRQSEYAKKYSGKSYEEIQTAIKNATGDELDYLKGYTAYSSAEDFEKALGNADKTTKWGKVTPTASAIGNLWQAVSGRTSEYGDLASAYESFSRENPWDKYKNAPQTDATFHLVADNVTGQQSQMELNYAENNGLTYVQMDKDLINQYNNLSAEEKNMANYAYSVDGWQGLQKLLTNINRKESKEKVETAVEGIKDWSEDKWYKDLGYSLASVVGKAAVAPQVMGESIEGAILNTAYSIDGHGDATQYNPYGNASGVNLILDKGREAISEDYSSVGKFAYQTAMSTLDSYVGGKTFGLAYAPMMGTSAYSSTYAEALDKGLTADKANLIALSSGTAEALFEYVSLDKLLTEKNITGIKSWVKETLKQAGVEGSEEVFTEIANIVADGMINGSNSDYGKLYSQFIEQGYSEEEARKLVALQASKDVALAGIGGAISGGLMGGVENAIQGARLKESGRTVDTATLRNAVKGTIFADELSQLEADFHGVSKTDSYYARMADIADRYETSYGEITESYQKEVSKAIKKGDINTALTTPKTQKLYDKIRSKRKNKANQFSYEELQKKTEKFFVGESTKYEGNDIKIADVKVDGETVSLTDTDGNTYDAKTVELSPADSLMVATAESIEDDAKRSAYVKNFDGQNVALYNDAFEYVWTAAEKSGAEFDFTSIAKTFDDSSISKATIASIYEASKMAQKTAMDSLDKAISEIKHVSSKGSTNGKFIDDTDYDSLTFTEKQLYKFAQALSLKGINVRVYKDVSESSSNGFYAKYDADTKELLNRIDINLAARQFFDVENNSRTYVINTMAHELTHFIAQNAEEEYKELYKLIRDYYGEEQWNTFVNKQISDDKDAYVKEHGSEEGYTAMAREIAEEEVIARACEDMMSDEKMVAEVFKNVTVDVAQSLKAKIKKWFDEAIAFIKKFMSGITGTNEMSEMLSKDLEVLEKAKEVWLKGIDKAMARSRDINASLARVNVEITKEGYAVETRNSQKTFKASEYSTNLEKAAKDLAEAMECTVEEAKQYIKDVGSIANKIAKDQERLDYIASEGLSAWVSNPEYGGSLDYSFLCPKRLTYTGTMNAILKKQNDLIFSVDDFLWLRKALINSGYEAPCSFCFVESARARFGKYNEQFLQIAKDEKLSYIPTAEDLTNPDMLEKMRSEHKETYNRYVKFLNSLSQRKPKMLEERRAYDGDILKAFLGKEDTIASKNIHGGIRFNSFSDFEVVHMIDCMQAILDMSRVGLAGFGYTKQKAFAEVFGNTGLKINCSTVAKGVDSNGKIIFDDIEGMNHKDALKLRNNNVGICCVVFTDEQLKAALVDDRIDYVLPFHRSQWSKKEYARMGLSMDTKDFTKAQTEKLGTKKSPDGNIPFLSYWNPNQTGAETVQKYLDIINAEGKTPLFPMALEKDASGKWIMPIGKKMKNGNYLSKEERIKEEAGKNYYKLLCEFKLYDANGNGIPQTAVKPTFNMKAANKLLKDYDGSHKTFPIAQNVVDEFETFKNTGKSELVPDWESLRNTRKSVKVNSEGTALTKGQQEFFKDSKVVDDQGRLKVMYHGSRAAGFSVFQTMYSDDNRSFFFTDSKDVAVEYGNSDIEFIPDKEYSFEELSDMITYFTKGEQSIAKDGNKIVLSYHDEETYEEKTKTYDSLESARDGFFDYLENWRGVNARATYKVYLNLVNPLIIDADYNGWSEIPFETNATIRYNWDDDVYEITENGNTRTVSTRDVVYEVSANISETAYDEPGEDFEIDTATTRWLSKYAKENGYDGVIIKNVIDNADDSFDASTVAIAFNSNQIKSVNNANPTDNADIRKSVKTEARLSAIETVNKLYNDDTITFKYDERFADFIKENNVSELTRLLEKRHFESFVQMVSEHTSLTEDEVWEKIADYTFTDGGIGNVDGKTYVNVHELSEDSLRRVIELGGLASPSMAVVDVDRPVTNFGSISLIFPSYIVNPEADPMFYGDAYSTSFPAVAHFLNEDKFVDEVQNGRYKGILTDEEMYKILYDLTDLSWYDRTQRTASSRLYDISSDGIEGLAKDWQLSKSLEKIFKSGVDGFENYSDFANAFIEEFFNYKKLYREHSYNEETAYGSIRHDRFRNYSLEDAVEEMTALGEKDFDMATGKRIKNDEELMSLASRSKLKGKSSYAYYEAKPQREIYLGDARYAVLPATTDESIKEALNNEGVKIVEYSPIGDGYNALNAGRIEALNSVLRNDSDVRYSKKSSYKSDAYYSKITPATRKESEKLHMLDDRNIARYRKEIDGVFNGTLSEGTDVLIGMPSKILIDNNISNRAIHINQSIIQKISYPFKYHIGFITSGEREDKKYQGNMNGKHNLGISAVKNLPLQIADPIAITKNNEKNSNKNSVVLWTNWIDKDGKGIMLGLVIDSEGALGKQNNISTVFQADEEYAKRFFEKEENILYTKNKKDINQLLSVRRYMPQAMTDDTFIQNVIQNYPGVKYKSVKTEKANVELGTLFSGADTFAFAINGFIHTQFAAENRPDIVGVYNMNHGGIVFENVLNINPKDMPKIQHLQVSPPCINLSSMNHDRREKPIDRKLATKVAEIITEVRPRAVTIENVEGYMKSESMGIIRKALEDAGYKDIDVDIYKDADYGGYTSRERVILRAMRDEELPAVKGKVSKHKGWIEAVGADYLESLPNAKTVNPRMVESLKQYNGINPYKVTKPLFVFGESYKNKQFGHAYANETLPTIIAESGASRVFLPGGTVKEVTPEMLAKLMGLDGFKLPDSKVLARRVIGNGIPAAITQNVMGPLIEQIQTDNAERIAKGEEIRYSKKTTAQERHEKVVAIDSITREAKTLATWMSENSGKHAVPVELQIPVGELLNAIDFSSKQLLGMREGKPNNGKPTQNDISLAKAMNKMNVILTRTVTAQENGTDEATLTKWLDLPDGFDKIFNILTAKVNDLALSQMDNANALQEMSLEELKALNEAIKSIKSSVQTMNDLLAGINAHKVDGVGHKSMGELDEVARRERETKLQKGAASITDFMDFTNGVPQYVFEHLGDGALEMFNEIKAGWSKYAFRANEVIEFANAAFTEDQVKEWSKEEHTFNLVSGSVTMTTAQLMSLYCLSKREQARGHIFGGGIAVGGYDTVDAENGKKKLRVKKQGTRTVAESELEMMLSELTSEQKAVADTLQKYMTTTLANWGNEISMKRFGILQFAEENYFPIKANNTILNAEPRDSQKSIYALLNMGFTKALTDNANNEIIINSIFTEFTEHAGNMAKYNSLALPVLDLVKWFNYKEKIQNEDKTHVVNSVRKSLEGAYGTAAEQYIRHLLYDLNGQREMARGEDLIGKFMRGYKISAVAANLQVALLQPLSYARAAYVMDVKYLQKGLTRKPQIEKCQQYSGIALWKIKLGFYDTDISRGLDRMILHNDSTKDKVIDASGKFAEWGDTLTWGVIWNACEAEVMDKNPNLAYNSDEFNKKVAKRFDDVIFHTQVVDSTITRSDIMRGTTIAVKTITSFMSEPTLALNMLHDGMFRFRQTYAKTKNMGEAMKQHGKRISRAVAVYAVSSLLESLLRAGVSKWRNPEDDEKWAEKVIYNFRSELNVLRKIPIIKEIFDMMDGYKSTRMDTQVMQSSVDAGKAVLKSIQDGEFSYKAVYKMLVAISQATGLPMSNALREIEAVWNNSIGRMYPELYWKR